MLQRGGVLYVCGDAANMAKVCAPGGGVLAMSALPRARPALMMADPPDTAHAPAFTGRAPHAA